jgi:heme/copper-type cytochrome/quinol oxidase subunit 1
MIYSGVLHTGFFKAWCIVAVLPPLAVLALTGLTMRTGRPRAGAPLLWGIVGLLMALATVVGGVLWPYDKLRLVGSVFEQGVLELATLAAVLVGLGAIVYWGPKLYGRRVPDGAASGLAVLGLLAVALLALPNIALGLWKQPAASVGPFDINGPKALLNLLSTAGCALLFVVIVAGVLLGLRAFSRGDLAGDDPWDGNTLEWATSSPPPDTNFPELAAVSSPEPLLDLKTARETA